MDWLIYVIIFLIITVFIFERIYKKRSAKKAQNILSMKKLSDDNIAEKEMEDRIIESDSYYALKSSSIKLKKTSDDYLKSLGDLLEKKFSEKWQDDVNEIENLKKIAENLELPVKLFDLFNKLKDYVNLTQNDPKYRCESIEYIKILENIEEETNGEKIKYDNVISFGYKNKKYEFKEYLFVTYDEDISSKKLKIFRDDNIKIFSDTYYLHLAENSYKDKWKPTPMGVESFIPGDWISDLLELNEILFSLQKKGEINERYKSKIRKIEKQKKDFGLQ